MKPSAPVTSTLRGSSGMRHPPSCQFVVEGDERLCAPRRRLGMNSLTGRREIREGRRENLREAGRIPGSEQKRGRGPLAQSLATTGTPGKGLVNRKRVSVGVGGPHDDVRSAPQGGGLQKSAPSRTTPDPPGRALGIVRSSALDVRPHRLRPGRERPVRIESVLPDQVIQAVDEEIEPVEIRAAVEEIFQALVARRKRWR